MTTGAELVVSRDQQQRIILSAKEAEGHADAVINEYSGWATALMRVVERKKLYQLIRDKKYLYLDAWELIGAFDHAYADTRDVTPIVENGATVAYLCRATIMRKGVVIGGGAQMCSLDATVCRGKEGSDKDRAAASAAQSWAASKAFRMIYSPVVILAGYEATTAEEMVTQAEPDKSAHYCDKHNTNWFKKGKMRSYGHPVDDSKEWCHEPSAPVILEGQVIPATGAVKDVGTLFNRLTKEYPARFKNSADIMKYIGLRLTTDIKDPQAEYEKAVAMIEQEKEAPQ